MTQEYNKHDIALHLLEKSIKQFLDEKDYLTALHLAGAAEEIWGDMLKAQGNRNTLERRIEATRAIHRHIFGHDTTENAIAALANRAKNSLKHLGSPTDTRFRMDAEEESFDMLERAIENYYSLNNTFTPNMERFLRECTRLQNR